MNDWDLTPIPNPALIKKVWDENPVWEVFHQCECVHAERKTVEGGRTWSRGWLATGQFEDSETDFKEAVRRIGTKWADHPETSVITFLRGGLRPDSESADGADYWVKPKSITAEMCLADKFGPNGGCVKTYDPTYRTRFMEAREPWKLSTLLIRRREFHDTS